MNLIYVLTIVLMLTLHILIYKKQEKQNIVKWIGITIITFLCYNIFICVTMSFIKIKSTLTSLSILNAIVCCLFIIKIFKDKKIQKYYINKMDILALLMILVITIILVKNQYGIPMNIKNTVTDGAVHYFVADEFYNYSMLLSEGNSDILNLWNLTVFMPGAYINTGILFKIFSNMISETYFCKLFIIFEISIWYLSGLLMYILLSQNKKEEKQKILPLIFSLVYMLGYPLDSLLSGFSYLSLGLNIIIAILITMRVEINKYYKYILIFLLNFGIIFSYYLFAPIVYLAVFLQILINIKKSKEKIFKIENILSIFFTLIIPGIFAVLYFMVFNMLKAGNNPIAGYSNAISIPGFIYKNLITNSLIFILLSIYYIIYCIKNKKDNMSNLMLIFTILFMILLYIGMKIGKVSEYYYYKMYYLLWIFIICCSFYGIETIISRNMKTKVVTYIGIGIYVIGLAISILLQKNLIFFDIYKENIQQVQLNHLLISHKELEILDYYNKNINLDKKDYKTYMCIPKKNGRDMWIYAITKNPYNFVDLRIGEITTRIQQFIDSNKQYCVLFKEDYWGVFEKIDEAIEKNNLKVLFRNETGVILEKN